MHPFNVTHLLTYYLLTYYFSFFDKVTESLKVATFLRHSVVILTGWAS